METETIKGYIEEATTKSGKTNNTEWKRSVLKVNGKILASFDGATAQDIFDGKLKKGVPVEIVYKKEGNYNNIVSIFPLEVKGVQPLNSFEPADKVKTEVDWEGKEKRIIRQNVLNRAVELYISGKMLVINVDDPILSICQTAEKLEEWIWRDKEKKEGEINEETI